MLEPKRNPERVFNALRRLTTGGQVRVGQMLDNALHRAKIAAPLFYIEDDQLAEVLEGYAREVGK